MVGKNITSNNYKIGQCAGCRHTDQMINVNNPLGFCEKCETKWLVADIKACSINGIHQDMKEYGMWIAKGARGDGQ